ncbi:hypothetical protein [Aliamphritea spongicola]|nr:hypothetical protein [Aliamphritea spongicola]
MSAQHIPLYKRVEQHILNDIDGGRLVPGILFLLNLNWLLNWMSARER